MITGDVLPRRHSVSVPLVTRTRLNAARWRVRHVNVAQGPPVPGAGELGLVGLGGLIAQGRALALGRASSLVEPSTPFLNSFWASPRLRASFGSCDPPNRTSTTTAMISHSCAPMRRPYHLPSGAGSAGRWGRMRRCSSAWSTSARGGGRIGSRPSPRPPATRPPRRPPRRRPPPRRAHAGRDGRRPRGWPPPRWPSSTCAAHDGVHPRLGVVDVVPFVPLDGRDDGRRRRRPRRVRGAGPARCSGVPCFLYGAERVAARRCARRRGSTLAPDTGAPRAAPDARGRCAWAPDRRSSPTTCGWPSRTSCWPAASRQALRGTAPARARPGQSGPGCRSA